MGFRLGFITDEATQDIGAAAALAVDLGFEALELRTADGLGVDAIPLSKLREYRNIADANGLVFSDAASALFKCEYSRAALKTEFDRLSRLLDACDILGAGMIRAFPFVRGDADINAMLPYIADAGARAAEAARARSKALAFEADPSVYATNHRLLSMVLDAIDSPAAGAIYDPGNCVYDPEGETPYPDGYSYARARLMHVHIKDAARVNGAPECVKIGAGEVDYNGLLSRLARDGYAGVLSLETHYRKRRALDDEQLRFPGGHAFTEGGMEATIESARALKRLIELAGA